MDKKCHRVTIKLKVDDNNRTSCSVDGSVRDLRVAISIRGGDQWAQLSKKQAIILSEWLRVAVDEINYRSGG